MKPLRDQAPSGDASLDQASELLRSLPEHTPSRDRKQRIRAQLSSMERTRGLGRARVVVYGLVLASGFAFARSALVPWIARMISQPSVAESQPSKAARSARPPSLTPPSIVPDRAMPVAPTGKAHPAARGRLADPAPSATPPALAEVSAPPSPEDGALLCAEGVRKLRRDRDPKAALQILEQYLSRYPNGALVEEAWGASIEAASQTDDIRAIELAVRYLGRFPEGKYHALAERVSGARPR